MVFKQVPAQCSSSISREQAQLLLDQQANSYKEILDFMSLQGLHRIAAKKRVRNDYASINRLPNEIISNIMELALVELISISSFYYLQNLCVLTGISSRWRDVAIESPRLWAYLSSANTPELNEILLKRSKNAPLRVSVEYAMHNDTTLRAFVENVLTQAHRIKNFYYQDSPQRLTQLQGLFSVPAPSLETFEIDPEEPKYRAHSLLALHLVEQTQEVMPQLFAAQAPNLKTLRLMQVSVPWDSSIFGPILTCLVLGNQPHGVWPTMETWMNVLCRCNNLEELSISNFGIIPVPTVPDIPMVQLPYLSYMMARGIQHNIITNMISLIKVNNFERIVIVLDLTGVIEDDQTLSAIFPSAAPSSLSALLANSMETLEILPDRQITYSNNQN